MILRLDDHVVLAIRIEITVRISTESYVHSCSFLIPEINSYVSAFCVHIYCGFIGNGISDL